MLEIKRSWPISVKVSSQSESELETSIWKLSFCMITFMINMRVETYSHFSALSFGERCDFCQVLFIHFGRFSILFLYGKIGKLGFPRRLRPPQNAINESVSVLSPHTVPNPFTYKCGLSPNPIVCSFLFLFGIYLGGSLGILWMLRFYQKQGPKTNPLLTYHRKRNHDKK